MTGDALADLGDHLVGQPHEMPVVYCDPGVRQRSLIPQTHGADGSITTNSMLARNADDCRDDQVAHNHPSGPVPTAWPKLIIALPGESVLILWMVTDNSDA